jgi:hypothetical protein
VRRNLCHRIFGTGYLAILFSLPETNNPARALRHVGRGEISEQKATTGRAGLTLHRWPTSGGLSGSSLTRGDGRLIAGSRPRCKRRVMLEAGLKTQRGADGSAPRVVIRVVWAYFSPISLTFTCPLRTAWAAASLAMGTR